MTNKKNNTDTLLELLLALFFLVAAYQYFMAGFFPSVGKPSGDFKNYYDTTLTFLSGNNPYQAVPGNIFRETWSFSYFIYPPIFLEMFIPLTFISLPAANITWLLMNQFFLAGVIFLSFKIIGAIPFQRKIFFIALVLFFFPIVHTIRVSQINIFILFLLISSFYSFRKGNDILAGAFLGLATLTKLFPAILILFYLFKRQYRAAIFSLSSILALIFLSCVFFGPEINKYYFLEVAPALLGDNPWTLYPENLSLHRAFLWISKEEMVQTADLVLRISLLGLTFYLCKGYSKRDGPEFKIQYCAVMVVIPIISSLTWEHHLALLIFPLLIAFNYILDSERPARSMVYLIALAYFAIGMFFPSANFFQGVGGPVKAYKAVLMGISLIKIVGPLLLWLIFILGLRSVRSGTKG